MPQRQRNLRSISHPNQKNGSIVQYRNGIGNEPITNPTSGQVLTGQSDGTWAPATPAAVPSAFVTIKRTTIDADATFTVDTKTLAALTYGCGGGGGGGGGDANGIEAAGGGGGGGGYCEEWFTVAQLGGAGAAITVDIGALGAASNSNGGNGGNGADTTFGSLWTAPGGAGGTGTGASTASSIPRAGGRGGFPSTADVNTPGNDGNASYYAGTVAIGGQGGNSHFGQGGAGATTNATGSGGSGKGAGGGGGAANSGSGNAGGAGTAGTVVVIEFLSQ
jgi:hypothetical protein